MNQKSPITVLTALTVSSLWYSPATANGAPEVCYCNQAGTKDAAAHVLELRGKEIDTVLGEKRASAVRNNPRIRIEMPPNAPLHIAVPEGFVTQERTPRTSLAADEIITFRTLAYASSFVAKKSLAGSMDAEGNITAGQAPVGAGTTSSDEALALDAEPSAASVS